MHVQLRVSRRLAIPHRERADLVVELALDDHARVPAAAGRGRRFDGSGREGEGIVELTRMRRHPLAVLHP